MMMTGNHLRFNPAVKIPGWDHHYVEDPTAPISHNTFSGAGSPDAAAALLALQHFLPSNLDDLAGVDGEDFDIPVDAFSCDNFRMFDFKVKNCSLARSHDWTACPFAHPGEKARRRDPRKYHYSGTACPDFRKGACKRADSCEYAHGVFECWLHPARYRTQPCKDGTHCRRRVCFFAHTPEQLRVLPYSSPEPSPGKFPPQNPFAMPPKSAFYSPPSSPPTTVSPPVSPDFTMNLNQLTGSMRCLHTNKMKMNLGSPPAWGVGTTRPGFESPITPIKSRLPTAAFNPWGPLSKEEEPAMERVMESGRELRERIYAKLGKENSLERVCRVRAD